MLSVATQCRSKHKSYSESLYTLTKLIDYHTKDVTMENKQK